MSADAIPYSASCRGVSYYANPDAAEGDACATRIIVGTLDARLIAVDAETVPGWYAITSPPAIVRGIVVTGAQVKDGRPRTRPPASSAATVP